MPYFLAAILLTGFGGAAFHQLTLVLVIIAFLTYLLGFMSGLASFGADEDEWELDQVYFGILLQMDGQQLDVLRNLVIDKQKGPASDLLVTWFGQDREFAGDIVEYFDRST